MSDPVVVPLDSDEVAVADLGASTLATVDVVSGPRGAVGPQGPQGPQGVAGPAGTAENIGFRFYQPTATQTWTILHTLPFQPNVTVVDSTGREVWPGEILYVDETTIQLIFSAAFGGEAFLS